MVLLVAEALRQILELLVSMLQNVSMVCGALSARTATTTTLVAMLLNGPVAPMFADALRELAEEAA